MLFSAASSAIPEGYASLLYITGLRRETDKSTANNDPFGASSDVWPRGPLSVKYNVFCFSLSTSWFGPFKGFPSKSLITCLISISFSFGVADRMA